ncbi:GNAT family N-acetyltransferase [Beduini massiliensis]|uniref:GNAT family N-acetyltransferase n=1 Tax=Beduini massiliensis TaxID=1585974 RepID=UPI00059A8651|nr:GNAT family N-acetyltransferase [Beduini massiliensis]
MIIKEAKHQKDFFRCMKVRGRVFVDEQHVKSEIEIDDLDQTCRHFLVLIQDQPVAAMRAIEHEHYTKLGRICVLKEYRHQGIGEKLVNHVTQFIKGEFRLGAQLHAAAFYEHLGFIPYGEVFIEADIPHIMMKKEVK